MVINLLYELEDVELFPPSFWEITRPIHFSPLEMDIKNGKIVRRNKADRERLRAKYEEMWGHPPRGQLN